MNQYEDSFESDSTASDDEEEEVDAMSVQSTTTSEEAVPSPVSAARSTAPIDLPRASLLSNPSDTPNIVNLGAPTPSAQISSPGPLPIPQPLARASSGAAPSPPLPNPVVGKEGKSNSFCQPAAEEIQQRTAFRSPPRSSEGSLPDLPKQAPVAARHAEEEPEYQALSGFVAFNNAPPSEATPSCTPYTSRQTSQALLPVPQPPAPSSSSAHFVSSDIPERCMVQRSVIAVDSPQKSSDSGTASSAFSTLAQHLGHAPLSTPPSSPAATTSVRVRATPAAAPEFPAPSATAPSRQPELLPVPMNASTLPSLPLPGWATATSALHPAADRVGSSVEPSIGTIQSGGWGAGEVRYVTARDQRTPPHVAPLPPAPEAHRPSQAEERVSELREASEAVERLVRAFAMLKGYGALDRHQAETEEGAAPPRASVSALTTAAHKVGALSTMQLRASSPKWGPRLSSMAPPPPPRRASPSSSSPSVSRGDGEQLAEGLVLDCVLGLLQQRERVQSNGQSAYAWQAARPQHEVVRADDFSYAASTMQHRPSQMPNAGLSSRSLYLDPSSSISGVPGLDLPLFDPRDRQSAADLYTVVQEAVRKYVLRRVRTESTEKAGTLPLRVAPISAAFAWALLLDMASVCEEVARAAFDAVSGSPSAVYPVLVHFHGDASSAEVARTAMHCLPFEALSGNAPTEKGRIFRMACWVTREQLWTVADALLDTVREDVVNRMDAALYAPLTVPDGGKVPGLLLLPPRTPMFRMRPLPSAHRGNSSQPTGVTPLEADTPYRSLARQSASRSKPRPDLFDLPPTVLQKVAYHVSVLATDVLAGETAEGVAEDIAAADYGDTTSAVSEALGELLQDVSIKAAVQRRAREKLRSAQMARTEFVSASRQRKERVLTDKAEQEAEDVVQRILQEMKAQGAA